MLLQMFFLKKLFLVSVSIGFFQHLLKSFDVFLRLIDLVQQCPQVYGRSPLVSGRPWSVDASDAQDAVAKAVLHVVPDAKIGAHSSYSGHGWAQHQNCLYDFHVFFWLFFLSIFGFFAVDFWLFSLNISLNLIKFFGTDAHFIPFFYSSL